MLNKVELIDCHGSDERHALAAWTSTSRDLTAEKRARIPGLLKFLAENDHTTPFEKSMIGFLITCDTASHIHILKHRIGVSVNGESARYKELKDDKYYLPEDWTETEAADLHFLSQTAYSKYHETLEILTPILGRKRAKESARYFLPYATQVTLDVTFNFRSFVHFLKKRNAPDAQKEIRDISEEMLRLVRATGQFEHSLTAWGL